MAADPMTVFAECTNEKGKRQITNVAQGARQMPFLGDPNVNEYDPAVSPDGQPIAFVSERAGNPEIYMMGSEEGPPARSPWIL